MKIRFRMRLALLKSNIPGTVDNSWFANEKDNVCNNTRFWSLWGPTDREY